MANKMAPTTIAPTTPPAIAPTFELDFEEDESVDTGLALELGDPVELPVNLFVQ